jgi:hypothetical protein
MLRPGGHPDGLKEWYDKLAPLVASARLHLREVKPSKLTLRSGCTGAPDGNLGLTFLWRDYLVRRPDFTVVSADSGEESSSFTQALILTYLVTADGTTPSSRWVAFRELPDGMFYAQAFRGYAEERLAREMRQGEPETFHRACQKLRGQPLGIGDAGYSFDILPRIQLAAVYWLGDDESPSRTSILFEDTAPHYMPTDGLAILGSQLVGAITKAAQT